MAKKTILLVIDMQIWFTDMTSTCLPHILDLSACFRSKSWWQIFTQHGHTSQELTTPSTNQLVNKWGVDDSIHRGSAQWKLMPEIEDARKDGKGETVFKNSYDAFVNTDLEERLRSMGAERVVVCGVMTDCCCDTSARGAFNRGFETWLVSDACGTSSKEQHERGLKSFGYAFGDVVTTKEVLRRLEAENG
jgi:nicotinamidase-related amidase